VRLLSRAGLESVGAVVIKIYGHSDDCVEIAGDVDEELSAYDRGRTITIGGEGEGLEVVAQYGPGKSAVWQFTVRMVDEGVPCPWPIRIVTEHEYSLAVVIDCPPGTPVSWDGEDDK
jgi:hypothetical protein